MSGKTFIVRVVPRDDFDHLVDATFIKWLMSKDAFAYTVEVDQVVEHPKVYELKDEPF